MNVNRLKEFRMIIVAAVVAVATVLIAWRWIFSQDSIQAFVNARIVDIRAPIPGVWQPNKHNIEVGKLLPAGRLLGEIDGKSVNPLAVELRLQKADLKRNMGEVQDIITNLEGRIATRKQRLNGFQTLLTQQHQMQTEDGSFNLSAMKASLKEAEHEQRLLQSKYRRIDELATRGLVSDFERESTQFTHQMAQARIAALRSKLHQAQLNLQADELGLQLDGAMTFSYPQLRVEELEDEIRDLGLDLQFQQTSLSSLKAQYAVVSDAKHLEDHRRLMTDKSMLVWSIEAQGETQVAREQPIIRVIDCSDIWVEAFVDESAAAHYKTGDPVDISAVSGEGTWLGEVRFIRYGSGRITVGQPVTAPPPEIARRQLPVRVATVMIGLKESENKDGMLSCPVGLSVKVSHPG